MATVDDIMGEFTDDAKSDEEFRRQLREQQKKRRKSEIKAEESLGSLDRFKKGFQQAFGEGREVHREAFQDARKVRGLDIEAPRISQTLGTNPTFTRARDTMHGIPFFGSDEKDYQARIDKGLGLRSTVEGRVGQALGTLGNDIVQDRTRGLWWLLNAPQAVTSVSQESLLNHFAPSLYKSDLITSDKESRSRDPSSGNRFHVDATDKKYLVEQGYASISQDGDLRWKEGYGERTAADGKRYVTKQRYRPGHVDSLLIPTGIAVNAGIGLLNPLGGNEGYEAVLPRYDDPTKTSNVIGEVAAKYILGRTGNLLNWSDFKEARPDVSKDEYMRYKAFKWDKGMDLNPFDDGNITLPTGVLKATTEGIHGPEVQFLGRSLPLATTIMPTIATAIGTAAGAAWEPDNLKRFQYEDDKVRNPKTGELEKRRLREGKDTFMTSKQKSDYRKINRVRNGLVSGMASLVGSSVIGNIIEGERRRRNAVENELKSGNAEQYLGN